MRILWEVHKKATWQSMARHTTNIVKLEEGSHSPSSSMWEDIRSRPRSFESSRHSTRITLIMAINEGKYSSSSASEGKKTKEGSCFDHLNKNEKTVTTVAHIIPQHRAPVNHSRRMPDSAAFVSQKHTMPRNTPSFLYKWLSRFYNSVKTTRLNYPIRGIGLHFRSGLHIFGILSAVRSAPYSSPWSLKASNVLVQNIRQDRQ